MSQLICKDLKLGYDGKTVVSDINFSVNKGDYICIVGENGSGKTTLMRALLKLHPAISGTVETGEGLKFTKIGYLPQQTAVQRDFPATVKEIVMSGCLNHCSRHFFYTKEDKRRTNHTMQKLGIIGLKDRCYRELSGGQQQKVLLARALCATTQMLLLDEPTAALDPKASAELEEIIAELNRDSITVIMISHNIDNALKYASHILHIGSTQLFYGTKEEYLKSDIGKSFARGERE